MTEGEVVGWHPRLNQHELEQTLGDSEGQGSLVCCSSWGHKESGTTKRLTNNGIPLFSGNVGLGKVEFSGGHPCPAFKGEKVIHVSLALVGRFFTTEPPGKPP